MQICVWLTYTNAEYCPIGEVGDDDDRCFPGPDSFDVDVSRQVIARGHCSSNGWAFVLAKGAGSSWRFWWKGAVPAGLFGLFSLYMLAIVAYHAQNHVQTQVTKALAQQGLAWVEVQTAGLDIWLSGSPPSLMAARAAQRFAKEAKCNTWLRRLSVRLTRA